MYAYYNSQLLLTYGELCSLELANISWNKDLVQVIIRLMVRYAIVLPTERDQYLITCLLPHSQPPSKALYCGSLRRHFVPKVCSIPTDLWSRLLCSIISNLSQITDVSGLKRKSDTDDKSEDTSCYQQVHCATQYSSSPEQQSQIGLRNSSKSSGQSSIPQKHPSVPIRKRVIHRHPMNKYSRPATLEKGVVVWESGMIYNHNGIKFSIFPSVSEVFKAEERGIEICCSRDFFGNTIMA